MATLTATLTTPAADDLEKPAPPRHDRRQRRGRTPLIMQMANADCGVAALAMVLARFGRLETLPEYRARLDAGRDGLSMLDLKREAEADRLGPEAFGIRVDDAVCSTLGSLPPPLLAHWGGDHFVVIDKVRARRALVLDPTSGRRWVDVAELRDRFTGAVLTFTPEPVAKSAPRERLVWPLLAPVVRRHRGDLALMLLLTLVGTALTTIMPVLGGWLFSLLPQGRQPPATIALAMSAVLAGSLAAGLLRVQLVTRLSRLLVIDLTTAVLNRLLWARQEFFDRRNPGDLLERLQSPVKIAGLLSQTLSGGLVGATFIVVHLVTISALAPMVGLVTGALVAVECVILLGFAHHIRDARATELVAAGRSSDHLLVAFGDYAGIKAIGAEEHVVQRWQESFDTQISAGFRASRLSGYVNQLLFNLQFAALPLTLIVFLASQGQGIQQAFIVSTLAGMALAQAPGLATALLGAVELAPIADRIRDVQRAPQEPRQDDGAAATDAYRAVATVDRVVGAVEVRSVSFRHDHRSDLTLDRVSLRVAPGETVAIVGPSGSGKSTLALMLAGIYAPTAGQVLVDGRDLARLDLSSLRRHLGLVTQAPFLSHGTIRDALTLGHPTALDAEADAALLRDPTLSAEHRAHYAELAVAPVEEEQILRALDTAGLLEEVLALPAGLDTHLPAHGAGLSGGQRQRLAIARAVLRTPAILVLDEATGQLDPVSEAKVVSRLATLGCTQILVSHRASCALAADRVVVLERGRVSAIGTPAELAARPGYFRQLLPR